MVVQKFGKLGLCILRPKPKCSTVSGGTKCKGERLSFLMRIVSLNLPPQGESTLNFSNPDMPAYAVGSQSQVYLYQLPFIDLTEAHSPSNISLPDR
jgi:hypothetical protein